MLNVVKHLEAAWAAFPSLQDTKLALGMTVVCKLNYLYLLSCFANAQQEKTCYSI
jgi:hypothetical protein